MPAYAGTCDNLYFREGPVTTTMLHPERRRSNTMTKLKAFTRGVIRSMDTFAAGRLPLKSLPTANASGPAADLSAMRKDWEAVGRDIRRAASRVTERG